MPDKRIPIVTLQGPTGVGKSELALRLAEELGAHIVSADSRQVYRGLDIGTAKPTPQEQARVPHHLLNLIDPDERYSAGRFAHDAGEIINRLHAQGIPVLVVGGTGFYIRALLEELFHAPSIPAEVHERLRAQLQEQGCLALHQRLRQVDPVSAERLHPNDAQRVMRALEVFETCGRPMSELWEEHCGQSNYYSYNVLLTMERHLLYERIDKRFETMLEQGIVNELKTVLSKGYPPDCPGLATVGYAELLPHVLQGTPLHTCSALARQHTRNYAKRQLTWYRKLGFELTIVMPEYNFSEVLDHTREFLGAG